MASKKEYPSLEDYQTKMDSIQSEIEYYEDRGVSVPHDLLHARETVQAQIKGMSNFFKLNQSQSIRNK
jgi:hypothetical protein